MAKESIVREKAFSFAIRIVKLYQFLSTEKKEFVLSKQIVRSGTSIGANIEEADGAISKKEFSNKISIAYKEARETSYWLRLLEATSFIEKPLFESLASDCEELCKLLFAIIRTTRIRN
jgi:four helix bundle protein